MITLWKSLSAIVAAALIAGAITGFPGIEDAQATDSQVRVSTPAPSVSATNAQQIIDTADRGWPYRNTANVRLIALDKVK